VPSTEHHLLAVAHLDAETLQLEQHRQLDHIDPERHAGHAFALENHLDLISRLAEQAGLRMNGATQAE
jgi:hypothetical protein